MEYLTVNAKSDALLHTTTDINTHVHSEAPFSTSVRPPRSCHAVGRST